METRPRDATDGKNPTREDAGESLAPMDASGDKPRGNSGVWGNVALVAVLAVVGLAGVAVLFRLLVFTGKLVLFAGVGALTVWGILRLVRALRKP
jgi:hypothetical protein